MSRSSINGDQDGSDAMDALDEARLCDWLEGTAGPADAAAVEAILRDDPVLRARVEAIGGDRQRLRSLPPVTVPAEVRAAIDDRVARTLLLQSAGGPALMNAAAGSQTADWRRRRQRRTLGRRWAVIGGGLAGAAVLVFGVSSFRAMLGTPAADSVRSGPEMLAAAADARSTAGPAGGDAAAFVPAVDAVVMHGLPLRTSAPADAMALAGPAARTAGPADPVPALQIRGLTPESLEATLLAAADVGVGSDRIAVTRNLTTETLARMVPRVSGRGGEPLWAALDRDRRPGDASWRTRVDRRVQEAWNREAADPAADGRVLAGSDQVRPGWSEQIVFSEGGAAWTLSGPASRIGEILATLDRVVGVEAGSSLAQLDPVRSRLVDDAEAWRAAREQLRRRAAETPDQIVHLPVVLQSP